VGCAHAIEKGDAATEGGDEAGGDYCAREIVDIIWTSECLRTSGRLLFSDK
jgi:hypothetical protein